MYDTNTRNQFIELRAKGWSLSRIAGELKVAQRTLVEWNRQEKQSIQELRAWELEAMQEKILATHEQELRLLKHHLDIVEFRIFEDTHEYQSLSKLYKMASLLRSEIRKVCDYSSRHLLPLDSDPLTISLATERAPAPSTDVLSTDAPPTDSCHQPSTINHEPAENCTISASELPQAEKATHSDSLDPGYNLSTPPAQSLNSELSTVNCSEPASELPQDATCPGPSTINDKPSTTLSTSEIGLTCPIPYSAQDTAADTSCSGAEKPAG